MMVIVLMCCMKQIRMGNLITYNYDENNRSFSRKVNGQITNYRHEGDGIRDSSEND